MIFLMIAETEDTKQNNTKLPLKDRYIMVSPCQITFKAPPVADRDEVLVSDLRTTASTFKKHKITDI